MGRNLKPIYGNPKCIKFTDREGYVMLVKITEGPSNMLDRVISVRLTNEQLDKISDWEVDLSDGKTLSRVELE